MKAVGNIPTTLQVADDLTEQDLDRLCDLFELLDRWDREQSKDLRENNRASEESPEKSITLERRHKHVSKYAC